MQQYKLKNNNIISVFIQLNYKQNNNYNNNTIRNYIN